jgi:hypothetical protein
MDQPESVFPPSVSAIPPSSEIPPSSTISPLLHQIPGAPWEYRSPVQPTQMLVRTSPLPGDTDWVDMGSYWLNINKQGEEGGWKSARRRGWGHTEALLTASNFGSAAGHNSFFTAEEYALDMCGKIKREVTDESRQRMTKGTNDEPFIRSCYERIKGVTVKEVGLAIPKFDIRIGSSLDGMVGEDGCIEIKSPVVMYSKLIDPSFASLHPSKRIHQTHYDQIIGSLAITGRQWCDYCVCELEGKRLYIERIPFDKEYWETTLYYQLKIFMDYTLPAARAS